MARFDFIGGSYTSQSVIADAQRTANLYVETNDPSSKSGKALYSTPGLSRFSTLPDFPGRGCLFHKATKRAFAIAGSTFFEIFADGSFNKIGAVGDDGNPVSMAESNIQIMIASDTHGYCFTLASGQFLTDPANLISPLQVEYDDGFFVAVQANSNKFQYSNALDGTTWNALNSTAISVFPDQIVGFRWDHRQLLIFGNTKSVAYFDSGNTFTFDVVNGGDFPDGLAGPFARCYADNTTFYLGQDELGNIQAKRLNGYTPVRISTHAIETAWRGYPKVSDAYSFAIGFNGHTFIQYNFPSANQGRGAAWRYDVATGLWHEVFFLGPNDGKEYIHKSQSHMYAFGKHLVMDSSSGNIYEMNDTFFQDDGNLIKRVRTAPHIANERQRITFHRFDLDLEVGLGPQPPFTTDGQPYNGANGRGPLCSLLMSNDGGKTYGNDHFRDCGQAGQYLTRVFWTQLGQSRDRVFQWYATDPISWRLIDAYVDATGWGRMPTQRLTEKLRQQS